MVEINLVNIYFFQPVRTSFESQTLRCERALPRPQRRRSSLRPPACPAFEKESQAR